MEIRPLGAHAKKLNNKPSKKLGIERLGAWGTRSWGSMYLGKGKRRLRAWGIRGLAKGEKGRENSWIRGDNGRRLK
jgi:hypothetical protein